MKKHTNGPIFMKTVMLIFTITLLTACNKNDDSTPDCQGIDCLPPATQIGAGTFGRLVNGEPFVDNSGFFNCFYQFVDGEYYFGIQAEDNINDIAAIAIGSLKKEIEVGEIIPLNARMNNEFYALVDFNTLQQEGSTNQSEDGFIIFSEFTITNPNTGVVYQITEGRFDSQFTQ